MTLQVGIFIFPINKYIYLYFNKLDNIEGRVGEMKYIK